MFRFFTHFLFEYFMTHETLLKVLINRNMNIRKNDLKTEGDKTLF
jgi:hypothetical protein